MTSAVAVMVHSRRYHAEALDWDATVESDEDLREAGDRGGGRDPTRHRPSTGRGPGARRPGSPAASPAETSSSGGRDAARLAEAVRRAEARAADHSALMRHAVASRETGTRPATRSRPSTGGSTAVDVVSPPQHRSQVDHQLINAAYARGVVTTDGLGQVRLAGRPHARRVAGRRPARAVRWSTSTALRPAASRPRSATGRPDARGCGSSPSRGRATAPPPTRPRP